MDEVISRAGSRKENTWHNSNVRIIAIFGVVLRITSLCERVQNQCPIYCSNKFKKVKVDGNFFYNQRLYLKFDMPNFCK